MSLFDLPERDPDPAEEPDPPPRRKPGTKPGTPQPPVQRVIDSYDGTPCTWIRHADAPSRPGEECGLIHEHCRGHVKPKQPDHPRYQVMSDPCGSNPMVGQLVCHKHGGAAAQNKAKGLRVAGAQAAERAVAKLASNGAAPVEDPAAELAQLAGEAREWAVASAELVAQLDDPTITTSTGMDTHPLVKLHERAQDRAAKVLGEMVKLGLVEQRNSIEQGKLEVIAVALDALFRQHGLDPDTARADLAAHLRDLDAIEATATEVDP